MIVALVCGVLVAVVATRLVHGRVRWHRGAGRDPLTQVFGPDELRSLDAHLDEVAAAELGRIDADVARYVAGKVGHVVVISDHKHNGIELALSDGRRLTLGVVSVSTRRQLLHRTASDRLRPASSERNAFSYLLLLRGDKGAEVEVHARRVVLTP